MKRVGFITHRELPQLTDDDALAVQALRDLGIGVEPLIWDDEQVAWGEYDALVLRSCWDYHRRSGAFAAWIEHLRSANANLWNQPEVVRWNMDKSYLADLEKSGARIPRTVFIPAEASTDLAGVLEGAGIRDAVLKPTVSATAWQTSRVSAESAVADQDRLDAILQTSGAVVQEFVREIAEVGEWSLVFLRARYSHGVLKVPRPGEFRVQADFGGGIQNHDPPAELVEQAAAIVEEAARHARRVFSPDLHAPDADPQYLERHDGAGQPLLYARVDGVERQGKLILMELEAIEPELFFRADPSAPGRFAAAVQATCLTEQG